VTDPVLVMSIAVVNVLFVVMIRRTRGTAWWAVRRAVQAEQLAKAAHARLDARDDPEPPPQDRHVRSVGQVRRIIRTHPGGSATAAAVFGAMSVLLLAPVGVEDAVRPQPVVPVAPDETPPPSSTVTRRVAVSPAPVPALSPSPAPMTATTTATGSPPPTSTVSGKPVRPPAKPKKPKKPTKPPQCTLEVAGACVDVPGRIR
jgi:hypothetical protein